MARFKIEHRDNGIFVVDTTDGFAFPANTLREAKRRMHEELARIRVQEEGMEKIDLAYDGQDEETPFEFEVRVKVRGTIKRNRYCERKGQKRLPRFSADTFSTYEVSYDAQSMEEELDEKLVKRFAELLGIDFQEAKNFGFSSHQCINFLNVMTRGKIIRAGFQNFIAKRK